MGQRVHVPTCLGTRICPINYTSTKRGFGGGYSAHGLDQGTFARRLVPNHRNLWHFAQDSFGATLSKAVYRLVQVPGILSVGGACESSVCFHLCCKTFESGKDFQGGLTLADARDYYGYARAPDLKRQTRSRIMAADPPPIPWALALNLIPLGVKASSPSDESYKITSPR